MWEICTAKPTPVLLHGYVLYRDLLISVFYWHTQIEELLNILLETEPVNVLV